MTDSCREGGRGSCWIGKSKGQLGERRSNCEGSCEGRKGQLWGEGREGAIGVEMKKRGQLYEEAIVKGNLPTGSQFERVTSLRYLI